MFTDYDSYLFHEGTWYAAYEKMGAHPKTENNIAGTEFTLYAPNAEECTVITRCGGSDEHATAMKKTVGGVWEIFVPGVCEWDTYRYMIAGADGIMRYKSDPYAFFSEKRPNNASVVKALDTYEWTDHEYMRTISECGDRLERAEAVRRKPMSIYEVHLGSWKKDFRENIDGFLNYRRLADELSEYVLYMGFTHVELMGICEYPFDGSWGYQVTGYYSPTSRYGSTDDFKYFVDKMHRCGIGVILDWVPAHFPKDVFGLEHFDGTCLYESEDPLLAEYPEWGTMAFDHSKPEVRSFLISSACFWIREYHIDALRVDAVCAMLYTNYSRQNWRPNRFGGTENLSSIAFLRQCNEVLISQTGGYMIAEDSSEMQKITADVEEDGLGFMFKWNMGWMNDTLKYFSQDPIFRKWHHDSLTHTTDYVFTEYFVNVLSHDEVVHLKKSMFGKMSGAEPEKLSALKTLYTYQFTHPGKKLLFMGQEFADDREWDENRIIDWQFANDMWHRDIMDCVRKLNAIYRKYPCLHSDSKNKVTFEWINRNDASRNIISFIRRNPWNYDESLTVICNFSPVKYDGYCCGVPKAGTYHREFSSYDSLPGGGGPSDEFDIPPVFSEPVRCDGYDQRIRYNLRPYESVIFSGD